MARRKGKVIVCLLVLVLIGVCVFIGYVHIKNKAEEREQGNEAGINTDSWLTIIETSVEYRQESMSIDLLKGVIKTNEQVEKIFVNINGIGVQYLEFTSSLIQTKDSAYIAHNVTPADDICATTFARDATVTVDLYVEYGGRSYKVDTQKVAVKSSWTPFY